ncbi:MAG: HAMP domain-containing sensor histidine kinase [Nocardioidaceae bacterium]
MSLPIRVRLTVWYAALLSATILALSTVTVLMLRADLVRSVDNEIRIGASELAASVVDVADDPDALTEDPEEDAAEDDHDFHEAAQAILSPSAAGAQLLDASGRPLLSYGRLAASRPLAPAGLRAAALTGPAQVLTLQMGDPPEDYRVRVSSLRDQGQARVLVVAESLSMVEDAIARVVTILLLTGPAALLATAVGGYLLASRALRPVRQMTSDAGAIGIDRLQERVAVPGWRDETHTLAVTLNAMLARIEQGVLDKHRVLADASHELRTPLAIMRSEVDVALVADDLPPSARTVLDSMREEVDRMTRTIDNLLTLAQADEGRLELFTAPVDLLRVVDDAVRALRPLTEALGVDVRTDGEHCEVRVDRQRLQLMLSNLVDNAIKFSPPGPTVCVAVRRHADEVVVTVSDEGPGIPVADQEHLFDRFYRVEGPLTHDFGGSGLGLAICREVALAHGGRIWVDSHPGQGSAFSVALPADLP